MAAHDNSCWYLVVLCTNHFVLRTNNWYLIYMANTIMRNEKYLKSSPLDSLFPFLSLSFFLISDLTFNTRLNSNDPRA